MRYLTIALAFCVGVSICQATTSCEDQIIEILEPNNTVRLDAFFYSGKFLNDLGNYDQCTKQSSLESHYALALLSVAFANRLLPFEFAVGLCVPSKCNSTELSALN